MQRKIEQWANCNPEAMAKMSENAIMFAFKDAKADIVEMAKILEAIAYPRRGTQEENMSLQDFAELIQSKFSLDELSA